MPVPQVSACAITIFREDLHQEGVGVVLVIEVEEIDNRKLSDT